MSERDHVTYPADFVPPMTEARAREIIAACGAYCRWHFFWEDLPPTVGLESAVYTADELEAFAWWLRNGAGEMP